MKITLICPRLMSKRMAQDMQPLAFAILASLTPPDIAIGFYDERFEPIPYSEPTDLVALTVDTFTASHAYHIAAQYRRRGVPVVMGGYHPTLAPNEALLYADAIVIGEAEPVWSTLLRDAHAGRLQRVYRSDRLQDLAGIEPDRQIFRGKRYNHLIPIEYARGCRFACDFCANHAFRGSGLTYRPVKDVVAEVERLGSRFIFFVDDNFFANRARATELCNALKPLKIRWFCQTSLDIAADQDILSLMARSGCFGTLIGFESLDERNLQQMKKKANLGDRDYPTLIQRFHDSGTMIFANFVLGYDYDTLRTFDVMLEFALRSRFYLAQFNPLTPIPGTALYDRLRKENRLIYERWWLDTDYHIGQAAFYPRGMAPDELTEGCCRLNRAYYSSRTILARMLHPEAWRRDLLSLGIFLIGNAMLRQEAYNRIGHPINRDAHLETTTLTAE